MNLKSYDFFTKFSEESDILISFDGFVTTDETWKQRPIPSPSSRLYYVTEGSGMLVSDRDSIKLEPGHVYIAPCGIMCGYYGTPAVTKLFFHINVIMSDGYDLFSSSTRFAKLDRSVDYIKKMTEWYFGDDASGHVMLKAELWKTVSEFSSILVDKDKHHSRYSLAVSESIDYIRNNLSAGLTVSQVANAVFCSPGSLSSAFRRELGLSVAKYIEDLLMFEARRMLVSSDRSISNISTDLGFCDQFYFSRRFKKQFALSPREYRKSYLSSMGISV